MLFEKSRLMAKKLLNFLSHGRPLDTKGEACCQRENILVTKLNARMLIQLFLGMTVLIVVVVFYWPVFRHLS